MFGSHEWFINLLIFPKYFASMQNNSFSFELSCNHTRDDKKRYVLKQWTIWSVKCRNTTSYDVVQSKKQENRLEENKRPEEKIERWSSSFSTKQTKVEKSLNRSNVFKNTDRSEYIWWWCNSFSPYNPSQISRSRHRAHQLHCPISVHQCTHRQNNLLEF